MGLGRVYQAVGRRRCTTSILVVLALKIPSLLEGYFRFFAG